MTTDTPRYVLIRYLHLRSWGVAHEDVATCLGLKTTALNRVLRTAGLPAAPRVVGGGDA